MGLAYDSQNDVVMRFHHSVCQYNKKPVTCYADVHDPVNTVRIVPVGLKATEENTKRIKTTDEAFSADPPPLGYIRYNDEIPYVVRVPLRQTKEGLVHGSLRVMQPHLDYLNGYSLIRTESYGKQCEEPRDQMIDYKAELAQAVEKGRHVINFDFAMSEIAPGVMGLHYRNRLIGLCHPEYVTFPPGIRDGSYLSRILQNKGISLHGY